MVERQDKHMWLTVIDREDGRLHERGGTPGLFLSSTDHDAVWRDLGPTLQALLKRNENWPVDS